MFSRFFIDRPIFASVLSIMIVLAGGVAYGTLPVAQYPEITPPTVEVSTIYPGANALTVSDTVAAPIEQQINGVEDMLYMSSRSTNDGTYALTVTFKSGVDLNIAQVLVQNRVNLAQPVLPDIVKRRGVTVKKKAPTVLMIVNFFSPDGSRKELQLSNDAKINVTDDLARVPGVGDITYLGQRDYSMRLWLDPEKMAVRGLSATDVVHAIEQQNIQVAAGQVGQPPAPNYQAFQYTINTLGRLSDEKQFAEMILKAEEDGSVLRMRDICRSIELGALSYDQNCRLDGKPSVALSIYQLPGSNALDVAQRVRAKLKEIKARFPAGLDYSIVYDTTPFINESVNEVRKTLIDAVILVALVMLFFLQSWRAAVIPLAAVPVAIIGTFTVMTMLGYSLNNLTLFGLVLGVGIVVDDAIVVVEVVQHHIDHGLHPREATIRGMDEVAGPVIAVGLVLAAVFVPCVFISGIVGQFFRQFAVTIAVSTLISAFNSLTLSPALCALLLRKETGNVEPLPAPRVTFALLLALAGYFFLGPILRRVVGEQLPPAIEPYFHLIVAVFAAVAGVIVGKLLNRILGWAFAAFNAGFNWITKLYIGAIRVALVLSVLMLAGYGGLLFLTYVAMQVAPSGFIPNQDKGYLLVNVQLPDSSSLSRTDDVVRRIDEIARKTEGVAHTVAISGQSVLLGANAPNFGTVYVMLEPFENRHHGSLAADEISAKLQRDFAEGVPGALVNLFGAPPVDGLGAAGGFVLVVKDPNNLGSRELESAGKDVIRAAEETGIVRDAFTGFRADTPWLNLDIDRNAAMAKGVHVSEITNALQVFLGSLYVNDFNWFGRTWQVNVQAHGDFRQRPANLNRIQLVGDAKNPVPLGSVLKVKETTGPVMVQRYNLAPASTVTVTPSFGVSSGDAIQKVEDAAKVKLPPMMQTEWTELAMLQQQTGDTASRAFIMAVILAFLVLAAQYESWSLPLAIVLVVPMCLLSATAGVILMGQDINIFTQIGFVVLVGLACKNAILIVEFAKQRSESGADRWEATLEACRLRLRPIAMTSVAFILGVVPLVVAEGAGAEMRRALGLAVFAGMTGVTLFGIILTPVFFFAIQYVKDIWPRSWTLGEEKE
ncbi:MAG: efflux RND transporter permease subunit [Gemmataceae bacterium]